MDQQQYIISFDNGSVADGNRWASDLKESILDATSEAEVVQQRNNPYSQDLGATLSLVLGAPAVVVVAQALKDWLVRHRQVSITVKTPHGEIVATNITSNNALEFAKLLLSQTKEEEK